VLTDHTADQRAMTLESLLQETQRATPLQMAGA
jgi:hypothetical protein